MLCKKEELRRTRRCLSGEVKDIIQQDVRICAKRAEGSSNNWDTTFATLPRSRARDMVAELMITANYVFSLVMSGAGLTIPFRYQEMFDYVDADTLVELSPYYRYHAFSNAKSAKLSLYPREHCGIGLEQYCTMTSPARKSVDLFCQFQMKAGLQQGHPYAYAYVKNVMDTYMDRNRAVTAFVREQRQILTVAHVGRSPNITMQCLFLKMNPWRRYVQIDEGDSCMEAVALAIEYDLKLTVFIRVDRNSEQLIFPCTFEVTVEGVHEGSGTLKTTPVKLNGPPRLYITAD